MNINKLFRRYSRVLLMVFMSLLLVAFLIPQQIRGCGERRLAATTKQGQAFGRAISNMDLGRVRDEIRIMSSIHEDLSMPESFALAYYLLKEEARHMGIRVGRDEVKTWLRQQSVTDATLSRVQTAMRRSYGEIYGIIAEQLAVQKVLGMQRDAAFDSLPRQELFYRNSTQAAVAELSVLDNQAFVHLIPDPTEEELQAFFEECKARNTAHTEEKLEFGYLLPDRVQIEYLTVDPEKVKPKIRPKAAQKKRMFADHPERYTKPDPVARQPAQGEVPTVPMTYEEAEPLLREDVRTMLAIERAQSLVNQMSDEAQRPWSTFPRDDQGFAQPPTETELASFTDLRDKYTASHQVEVDYHQTELLDQSQLAVVAGIGRAAVGAGRARMTTAALAFRVEGILEDTKDGGPALNVMEPAPVVLTQQYDVRGRQQRSYQAYLFRVVQVAPSAPPDSLEPIRDRLVEDRKLVQAHELAGTYAEALAARAREVGLLAAVEQAAELKEVLGAAEQAATQPADALQPAAAKYVRSIQPAKPLRLTRDTAYDMRIGGINARSLSKAFFGLVDEPAADTAPAQRIVCVPLANQSMWAVGELLEVEPIYAGAFERQLVMASDRGLARLLPGLYALWRAPENLRQRTGFEPAGPLLAP